MGKEKGARAPGKNLSVNRDWIFGVYRFVFETPKTSLFLQKYLTNYLVIESPLRSSDFLIDPPLPSKQCFCEIFIFQALSLSLRAQLSHFHRTHSVKCAILYEIMIATLSQNSALPSHRRSGLDTNICCVCHTKRCLWVAAGPWTSYPIFLSFISSTVMWM